MRGRSRSWTRARDRTTGPRSEVRGAGAARELRLLARGVEGEDDRRHSSLEAVSLAGLDEVDEAGSVTGTRWVCAVSRGSLNLVKVLIRQSQRTRDSSVTVGPEWVQLEEIEFTRLAKLSLSVDQPEDL